MVKPSSNLGVCALCGQMRQLCRSHIVPEFAYKPIYDENNRLIAFSPLKVGEKRYPQKGLRDRLLCDECEGFLNTNFENPFKKYWIDANPLGRQAGQDVIVLDDVNYLKFKLFHLSVLWRASVCKLPEFCAVDLGPHEEWVRGMLRWKDPGPASHYPIMCVAITDDDGDAQHKFVASPLPFKLHAYAGYTFTFCGCQWQYVLALDRIPDLERLALSARGRLPVLRVHIGEVFRKYHQGVRKIVGLDQ